VHHRGGVHAAHARHQGEHQPEFEGQGCQVAGHGGAQAVARKIRKETHQKTHL